MNFIVVGYFNRHSPEIRYFYSQLTWNILFELHFRTANLKCSALNME